MTEQPARRGGRRPGAGRKPAGHVERTVCLAPADWATIETHRISAGLPDISAALRHIVDLLRWWYLPGPVPRWCPDCDSPVLGIHDADCPHD